MRSSQQRAGGLAPAPAAPTVPAAPTGPVPGPGQPTRPGRPRRILRTTLVGLAVLLFLAGALATGYSLRSRRPVVVEERNIGATVGVAPWAAPSAPSTGHPAASAAGAAGAVGADVVEPAADTGTQPPPLADQSSPGIALATGGVDLGNPSVVADGSGFSLFSTQSTPFLHVPVVAAPAGGSWGTETDALPNLPSWAGVGVVTAPTVHQFAGQWVLYFTAPVAGEPSRCIGTAVASSVTGPYHPAARPIVCQSTRGGSSDPSVFVDAGGGGDLVWESADRQVWSQPLAPDGQSLAGQPAAIYRPGLTWQQGTISSPSLVVSNGRYWLLYSAGGGFTSAADAIGAAGCAGPAGPCTDPSSAPLLDSDSQGAGPGDPSILDTGGQLWVVYNPACSADGTTPRSVDAARLGFGPTGPYLATPGLPVAPARSTSAQPSPAQPTSAQSAAGQPTSGSATGGRVTSTLSTSVLVAEASGGGGGGPSGPGTGGVVGTVVGGAGMTAV
ncbi:MAG TPA: family 43 glycosylhydrolase, partial [Acidimicrobiales bacterium]|nr:family 43 glycosylhydrolase [Acidimicrobiales bacterium]